MNRIGLVGLLVCAAVSATVGASSDVAGHLDDQQRQCRIEMEFEAAIRIGPTAGTVYDGNLGFAFSEDSGSVEGAFVLTDGTEIPVSGQAEGRALSLLFWVGIDQYIAGTGVSQQDLSSCPESIDGFVGGPLVGVEAGDLGDWRRKGKPGRGVLNLEGAPSDDVDLLEDLTPPAGA